MQAHDFKHVSNRELVAYLDYRFRRLELITLMATQEEIDTLTNKINEHVAELRADDSAIQQEIAKLSEQGVDTSALSAAVDNLASAVDETTALVPAPADAGEPANGGTGETTPELSGASETGGEVGSSDTAESSNAAGDDTTTTDGGSPEGV